MEFYSFLIKFISFFVLVLSFFFSFSKNKDLFSPVKIYTVFCLFFYADIFFGNYSLYVISIYFIQTLIVLCASFFEPKVLLSNYYTSKEDNSKAIIFVVWALSSIPLINQFFLINELGGVVATVGNISGRVKFFQGRGYIPIINGFIVFLNLVYFYSILQKPTLKRMFFYSLHFLILIVFGLLSGSRSSIVMTVLILFIMYNYYYKRVGVKLSFFIVFFAVIMVSFLGAIRNNVSTSDGFVTVNNISAFDNLELSHFKYGLIPLEIITDASDIDFQYGLTYLSLLTNFIPREIYPEKLDSGGIYFTKKYTGDAWGGDSNLATGAVTEGIINFGFFYGPIIGFLSIFLFYIAGIQFYKKFIFKRRTGVSGLLIIPYVYFVLLAARYSYSEFSYVIFNFILTVLLPYFVVVFFIKLNFLRR